ncbi:anthranilate synthase component I family protein [Streptomyces arboris]|uniref:anthranilate synthase component I family protein n=1 Tax=Streptomyces arboris TaxID=2600619 RepID=UPI003629D3CA
MAGNVPLPVTVTRTELAPHDPLDLYSALRRTLPADGVFLFESIEGADEDRRFAVVGFGRLAELRVFGGDGRAGRIEAEGPPALVRAIEAEARGAGLTVAGPEEAPPGLGAAAMEFVGNDALWTVLDSVRGLFAVETDVPRTTYAFGFLSSFAYESVWNMDTPGRRTKPSRAPDITLTLFRDTLWYDLETGVVRLHHAASPAFTDPAGLPADALPDVRSLAEEAARADGPRPEVPSAPQPHWVRDSVDRDTFLQWADRCMEHIRAGDVYQIQIGHRLDVRTDLSPEDVYRRLRRRNPSPYMYVLPSAGRLLIGASPELFLRIENDTIVMRPIAGTARRGPDDEGNRRRIKEMRESTKEQAEHIMLVDLCRNDIGRVSRPSTRPVDELMTVETFSHVFHLVSTVSGRLRSGASPLDAVRATFPAGTMTGAPKLRAMEIIDGLEQEPRGSYAGAVGLMDVRGWTELALCIRTIVHDGTVYSTQSSAGMVAQSRPADEWQETLAKMGAAHWALTGEELLS